MANLWVEYRIDWIEMEVIPAAASGSFGASAIVTLVDESGTLSGNQVLGDLVPKLSSQKTTELHTPYGIIRKRFNVNRWLGQTQQTAWLQTQQPNTT